MVKHYTSGVPNGNPDGSWPPGDLCGFDLADVSSITKLNTMPENVMGLVFLGLKNGVDQQFRDTVNRWKVQPKVWGYYLVDEPRSTEIPPRSIRDQVDFIHDQHPGAQTYIKFTNEGTIPAPRWPYNIDNTHIDLYGVGGYAVRAHLANQYDPGLIERYVASVQRDGIPLEKISPCYQCFGGTERWPIPSRTQLDEMFAAWRQYVPKPVMDQAYRWEVQPQWGTVSLHNSVEMRDAINEHFRLQETGSQSSIHLDLKTSGNVTVTISVDGHTVF